MSGQNHFLDLRQVRILTRDIPKVFVDLLRRSDPLTVYICSPWISEFSEPSMNFIRILANNKSVVKIFTRPPKNIESVELLQKIKTETKSQIFLSRNLHAKIYVIEGKKDKSVIIGSANFTKEARGNIEIGLLVSQNDLFMKRVIYAILSYLRPACKRWR